MEDDLAARLEWVVNHGFDARGKRWSQRKLGLAAGLSSSHIGLIIRHEIGGRVAAETLQKIAEVARCNFAWLSTGLGEPRLGEEPDPYPNRALAAQLAQEAGVHPAAIADVLAEEVTAERATWPTLWWADLMQRRETELLRQHRVRPPLLPTAPAPLPHVVPPSPPTTLARPPRGEGRPPAGSTAPRKKTAR